MVVVRIFWILFLCGALLGQTQRGFVPESQGDVDHVYGNFHLLSIGIDTYRNPEMTLSTATHGARALRDLLVEQYTFEPERTRLLLDEQATRAGIIDALRDLISSATKEDSVLIYYAGHGDKDDATGMGSWLPWEANKETPSDWISTFEVKNLMRAMKARHVLLISDSCFSGDFFSSTREIQKPKKVWDLEGVFFDKFSRRAMTSGGVEPVSDSGKDGHSIYTWWLLQSLKQASGPYVLPEVLHHRIKNAVTNNAKQKPLDGILSDAGGEPDGSFVFFRRDQDAQLAELKRRVNEAKEAKEREEREREEARKLAEIEELRARLAELEGDRKPLVSGPPKHGDQRSFPLPGGETITMIYLEEGTFMMGSDKQERGRHKEEAQHPVTLTKDFWLGRTEVTRAQWRAVMGYVSGSGEDNHPVTGVSWTDIQSFLERLDAFAGGNFFRLPSEAEWEYACRAGVGEAYHFGYDATQLSRYACFRENGSKGVKPVGSFEPNYWGFHDMHGNAREWCEDRHGPYPTTPVVDPRGANKGKARVLRGGSYIDGTRECRSASRERAWEGYGDKDFGFRLARTK